MEVLLMRPIPVYDEFGNLIGYMSQYVEEDLIGEELSDDDFLVMD
jgi:hypothetical protein